MQDLSCWLKLLGLTLVVMLVTGHGASQSHGADDATN